jgi:hypothetical protein
VVEDSGPGRRGRVSEDFGFLSVQTYSINSTLKRSLPSLIARFGYDIVTYGDPKLVQTLPRPSLGLIRRGSLSRVVREGKPVTGKWVSPPEKDSLLVIIIIGSGVRILVGVSVSLVGRVLGGGR